MSDSEPLPVVEGLWRHPGAAAAVAARLSVDAGGMATVSGPGGDALARAAFAAITVSDRVGSIPRQLDFGTGVFETRDNNGVDRLQAGVGGGRGFVHGLEQFRPRLIGFVAVTIALCFALYRYGMPLLVEAAVLVTPPAVTDVMGRSVLVSLDQLVFSPSALPPERRKVIQDGFDQLVALTPRAAKLAGTEREPFELHFRQGGTIGPNAFALPDGSIVLTDELVGLSDDNEMILGVLAHEIGHVERDHSLRQLYRAAGATALIMLIGGDVGGATEDLLLQGSALVTLSYSRGAEAEADRYSVELMHKAGKDPAAISRFFEILIDTFGDGGSIGMLSTHPATRERIEATRRYAEEIKAGRAN
jgi:Zn-dependent protease with chaperone function